MGGSCPSFPYGQRALYTVFLVVFFVGRRFVNEKFSSFWSFVLDVEREGLFFFVSATPLSESSFIRRSGQSENESEKCVASRRRTF